MNFTLLNYLNLLEHKFWKQILRDGMHSNKNVETKEGQHDVVTYFDRKTEEALINSLSGKFPDHKFIAEESSYKKNVMLTDSPTWIIDPIDGTTNFVHAFPFACISVALAIHKEVVLGIIYNPSNFEMYTAVKGKGSFLNDEPINTSKITELNKALLGCEPGLMRDGIKNREFKETRIKALINVTQGSRAIGSAALTMAYIARGVIDCFQMDTLQPWDIAAGMLIIREAGGVVVNSKGGQLDFMKPDLLAAANETLMHKAVSVLEQTEKNK
ncbi:uncharacterized protein [Prorops nasuta]|uniref:uncharacterized protein isoform X2 n=1 Tax=Prorops nasuta TaxID=863751 RepID=UPI0034CD3D4D